MLQTRFWNLLFFGLVTSLGIYTLHFSDKAVSSSSPGINSGAVLAPPDPGKKHVLLTHGAGDDIMPQQALSASCL
jgi:predicted esterase